MRLLLILTFSVLTIRTLAETADVSWRKITNTRLPTNLYPLEYTLNLTTFLPGYAWEANERDLSFEGTVFIKLGVNETTNKVVLHSDSLEIYNAVVNDINSSNLTVTTWEAFPEDQFIILYLNREVNPNEQFEIIVNFSGKLRDDMKGFYITKSTRADGQEMLNAVTQFETTAARYMVPCFDEPEFKATWQVNLTYPTGSVALSNTIEDGTVTSGNFTTTHYKRTVKMSSYLLAIFIGDIQYKETTTDSGVRLRVYTDPATIDQVDNALNVSKIVVEGFENLFGIKYPMEKLDFVTAYDFEAGAMENWGLLVHKPNFLLGWGQEVAEVVIHELAHQWFGNFVTMKYWNQIWLNEGFASYMESIGYSFIKPNFDFDHFHLMQQSEAKELDKSIPLNEMTYTEDGSIDIITFYYPKGSSLIRMLEIIVGKENFINALSSYLLKHQYSNTEDKDLYDALKEFHQPLLCGPEEVDIEEFARCWTHQNGYPTVYVESTETGVILTQRKESPIEADFRKYEECGNRWDIPIWYQEAGSDNEYIQRKWFKKEDNELKLTVQEPVIINANSYGYYDVVYSNDLYESIAAQLKNNSETYSDNSKLRVLIDVNKYAILDKVPVHNAILIAESLLNDKSIFIRANAERALLKAKAKLEKQKKTIETDIQDIENRPTESPNVNMFSGCDSSETFLECYKRTFDTNLDACLTFEKDKSVDTTDRLAAWLKSDKSDESRQTILRLLSCGDIETFRMFVSDTSYNWTPFEKELIVGYFENYLFKKYGPKEKKGKKASKSRSYFDEKSMSARQLLSTQH
ncbi:hypothetical protein GCK72_017628 [Caenorhabditis remanei]|uniref:Aminopeptidase n=1 Tax=Caenorhabditis remanei TaxID=31234 RepID=A0A6A5G8B4_CAERE|nr:hypothetical protein GCK72_017628 [Caenorhabditis remanei]KAF1751076.1 hypothetical protein GCK72_017628 [Caenorhabditis remanei]